MKRLPIVVYVSLCSLFLNACGGDEDFDTDDLKLGYTLVEGEMLKTCQTDGEYIHTPEDSAYLEGCQLINGLIYLQPTGENISLADFHLNELILLNGALHIADSPIVQDLNGLENLRQIKGALFILYNDKLADISALNNLARIDTNLLINDNPALTLISLSNLQSYQGEMQITHNESLESIEFPSLALAGTIGISSNNTLTSIDFPSLISVDEVKVWNLNLTDYAQLESFRD